MATLTKLTLKLPSDIDFASGVGREQCLTVLRHLLYLECLEVVVDGCPG